MLGLTVELFPSYRCGWGGCGWGGWHSTCCGRVSYYGSIAVGGSIADQESFCCCGSTAVGEVGESVAMEGSVAMGWSIAGS